MMKQRTLLRVLAGLGVVVSLAIAGAPAASAYDGNAAAAYAEANVLAYGGNSAFPNWQPDDCTNFISQAVRAGGYPYRQSGPNLWYIRHVPVSGTYWIWQNSTSWIRAAEYRNFLIADYPGGNSRSTAPGSANYAYTPAAIVKGDVLNYDFGTGHGISHSAMQVGLGAASGSPGWSGNFVDYHSSNKKHVFWSLLPNNVNWATTTVYLQHISSAN